MLEQETSSNLKIDLETWIMLTMLLMMHYKNQIWK